jgi:hypothetical protein
MPNPPQRPAVPEVRKGQGDMQIPEAVFRERLRERCYDPSFERASGEIDKVDRHRVARVQRGPQESAHARGRHRLRRP